ncbi:MAG: hypothetical protein IKW03_04125 [Clostridia bacterium]|nr:hypothetical protein [Clostridia bacterium]
MKRLICIILSLIMLFCSVITSYAEDSTDDSDIEIGESVIPPYTDITNISLTFYIVNGKAVVSYVVSSKTGGMTVDVKFQKEKMGFVWVDAGKEQTEKTDKKYISGSYSAAVNASGNYRIVLEVTVNGERNKFISEYQYDKTKVYGDAIADGVIRANDARLILRFSAKLEKFTEKQKAISDIDNNGLVTAADARIALRLAAKLI